MIFAVLIYVAYVKLKQLFTAQQHGQLFAGPGPGLGANAGVGVGVGGGGGAGAVPGHGIPQGQGNSQFHGAVQGNGHGHRAVQGQGQQNPQPRNTGPKAEPNGGLQVPLDDPLKESDQPSLRSSSKTVPNSPDPTEMPSDREPSEVVGRPAARHDSSSTPAHGLHHIRTLSDTSTASELHGSLTHRYELQQLEPKDRDEDVVNNANNTAAPSNGGDSNSQPRQALNNGKQRAD